MMLGAKSYHEKLSLGRTVLSSDACARESLGGIGDPCLPPRRVAAAQRFYYSSGYSREALIKSHMRDRSAFVPCIVTEYQKSIIWVGTKALRSLRRGAN